MIVRILLLFTFTVLLGCESHKDIPTKEDIISEDWDEVMMNMNGQEFIEACSDDSGNCYTLVADISNGTITQIYFPNGGYLYFDADLDSSGEASDTDEDGNGWDFTIDMTSPFVTNAIDKVIDDKSQ